MPARSTRNAPPSRVDWATLLRRTFERGRHALHRLRRAHDGARGRDGPRVHPPPSRCAPSRARPTRRRLTSPPSNARHVAPWPLPVRRSTTARPTSSDSGISVTSSSDRRHRAAVLRAIPHYVGRLSSTSASSNPRLRRYTAALVDAVTLAPLRCHACRAFVPLGQGKYAHCAYCAADSAIPPEYGALQRAGKSFADDHALAASLYGKIGKPPGRVARLVGGGFEGTLRITGKVLFVLSMVGMFGGPFIVLPFMVIAYGLGYPVAKVLRWVFTACGSPFVGPMSAAFVLIVTQVLIMPFFAVPIIWWRRERELTDVRRDIHASLAAEAPERPGGPSRCRSCGAALDVPAGALGVPCAYCKVDNLVALPGAWVARVRSREFRHFMRIDAALDAYRAASHRARERGWKTALTWILTVPLVLALGLMLDSCGWSY